MKLRKRVSLLLCGVAASLLPALPAWGRDVAVVAGESDDAQGVSWWLGVRWWYALMNVQGSEFVDEADASFGSGAPVGGGNPEPRDTSGLIGPALNVWFPGNWWLTASALQGSYVIDVEWNDDTIKGTRSDMDVLIGHDWLPEGGNVGFSAGVGLRRLTLPILVAQLEEDLVEAPSWGPALYLRCSYHGMDMTPYVSVYGMYCMGQDETVVSSGSSIGGVRLGRERTVDPAGKVFYRGEVGLAKHVVLFGRNVVLGLAGRVDFQEFDVVGQGESGSEQTVPVSIESQGVVLSASVGL